MVKVIVYFTKAIIAITLLLLCFSCGFESLDGTGNVISQKRKVTGTFNSITANKGLEVIIQQGAEQSVTVDADENLQEHITAEVKGNELKISSDVNIGNGKKTVIVIMPNVTSLTTESSASIISEGQIKSESVKLSSNSGSHIKVSVEAKNLDCETNSGAHIEVSGLTEKLEASASSGGNINARGLKAENVNADASSGGSTTVNPVKKLSADASSGGKVLYVSTPSQLKKNASSGGVVSQL